MLTSGKLLILWDLQALGAGHKRPIFWEPRSTPHMLVVGATGSGKTYFTKLLLGKIALREPTAQLYVCDFKGDEDFEFLSGCQRFFRFMDCQDGLQQFYDRFRLRQSGEDSSRNMMVLFFDEWAAFCNSLDKKELEEEKRKLSTLLMLGRSFRVHVIISQQRADAEYFAKSRDNFGVVVALGNISKESAAMFGFEREEMQGRLSRGEGHALIDGRGQVAVRVPSVGDVDRLRKVVQKAVQ